MNDHFSMMLRNRVDRDWQTQYGALCYRVEKGKHRILLVTTRGSGRWIVPKGWPMDGKSPAEAALREAWEEAGVKGQVYDQSVGTFDYIKVQDSGLIRCRAELFPVRVSSLASSFPEKGERIRKWVSPVWAAAMVRERDLSRLLRDFDPRRWH